MQRLGQHFLKNKSVLAKIAQSLKLGAGDLVVEIGPGHGELTEHLLAADKNLKIKAIEKDRQLIAALKEKFMADKGVEIMEGDALKTLPSVIEALAKKKYKLVGNIPYYITGKLLRMISELEKKPERTVLLLQREVAERICAAPPDMNRLAASVQFWAEPKIIGFVPKGDFSPPPEVDSAIILLETRASEPLIDAKRYYSAVRAIFAQPRKTTLNNAAAATDKKTGKEAVARLLEENHILPGGRPQDLSREDIITIAKSLFFGDNL